MEEHARFKLWMDHCDELVTPMLGIRLTEIIYGENLKDKPFDRLRYSNPALISIEYALAKIVMESGCKPDLLVGYSLGELTAAAVSGVISLSDALQLSIDYADIMEQQSAPGAILAILDSPKIMETNSERFGECYFAGANFDNHFVVSGLREDILRLHLDLKANNIISQLLPVNYAFHSPVMQKLMDEFIKVASYIDFRDPKVPVWSAYTGMPVSSFNELHFWHVVRDPIQFSLTVKNILTKGEFVFVDVGPSGTLSTFIKYLLPQGSRSVAVETLNQYGRDIASLDKLTEKLNSYKCASETTAIR